MAKKNKEYWQGRFEQLEKASHNEAVKTYMDVEKSIMQAQRDIETKINSWYVRFANNNQITIAEAKKLLNSEELKEFKWDVQDYIKYGHENGLNQQWMKELENASAKYHISRLESIKIQTQQTLEVLFGNELDEVDKMASNIYTNNYYHTMFELQKGFNLGFDVSKIDDKRLQNIINKPWAVDEKNFSERIWGNKTTLINELHDQLTRMCATGKAPDDVIKYMSKKFNTTKARAGNLIMTESTYFSSVAQQQCFKDLDVEKYEIVATLDSHTSETCRELDGKIYDMKDYQPGVTAPPFHNYCRSTTVPAFDDDFDIGERAAKDEDGKTYYVPANMKYNDWYDKYVKETPQVKNNLKNEPNDATIKEQTYKKLTEDEHFELIDQHRKSISEDVRKSIYKTDWDNMQESNKYGYINSNYSGAINYLRREGKSPYDDKVTKEFEKTIQNLQKAIATNKLKENLEVTRFLDLEWLQDKVSKEVYKQARYNKNFENLISELTNKTVPENQFISASINEFNVYNNRPIKMIMKIDEGTNAFITENKMESEIVFDDSDLLIESIKNENDILVLVVKLINRR